MSNNHVSCLARKAAESARRLIRWAARRRRTAVSHLLRGACYGVGTGCVSLLVLWAQGRM
ncbi:hypothetical protein [Streptomyces sp. NPDC048442]|uniref:hypothetical protein n=1 Tax=Streptomyces sp. NPDC048442 TaxID=3154823 RepID=UPI00343D8AA9